jgi:hypothetical protein
MWSLHPRDSSARLNSLNAIFSQWGHLKTKVYQTNPHVYEEIRNISNPDMSTYPKNYCVLATIYLESVRNVFLSQSENVHHLL